ncbi:MAG TPA: hypothetical protein VEQ63_10745, partial [Bryobacteraceae bacterium]|nr:hypothetical protein [Bryobacteraceae bacterium]
MNSLNRIFLSGLTAVSLASAASMTGWISDASCGASNAKAAKEARECTETCLKNGAAPVFVSDGDNKVYKLAGTTDQVKNHLKHKVKVTGDL